MPRKKTNSRALRQFAEDAIEGLASEVLLPESERGDFVTSLVRQWLTYDGNASFFMDEERAAIFILDKTVLGKTRVRMFWARPLYMKMLYRDWKISPDDMPDIIDQLNRGQAADVVNTDGIALRLWVNPKEGTYHVEPVNWDDFRKQKSSKPDYVRMAANILEEHHRQELDEGEREELARSVAQQWQRFDGNACIFLDPRRVVTLTVSQNVDSNGMYRYGGRIQKALDIAADLALYGIPPEDIPDVLARINLAQPFEFQDNQGVRRRLRYDPKAKQFWVEPLDGVPRRTASASGPVLCPKCTAVLDRWQKGERQKTCKFCGQIVSLP